MSEYEIRVGREIRNGSLHVGLGAAFTHTFLPYLPAWAIIMMLILMGAGREYWQRRRGKIQPFYIHVIDTLTFGLGGLVWWGVKRKFKIDVDEL